MSATELLPWNALKLAEPQIPWDALRALADAAAQSEEVRQRLCDEMRRHLERRCGDDRTADHEFVDLAVPAVFALAAQQLDGVGRKESARFLLELLLRAGENDDDWLLDVLQSAAARLGGAAAEPTLAVLERCEPDAGAWFHLFTVLRAAARQSDGNVRQRILEFCRRRVSEAPDRFECWSSIDAPARVLAGLRDTASLPLLEAIEKQSECPELADIIDEMRSAAGAADWDIFDQELEPLEEWVGRQLRLAREYLAESDDDGTEDSVAEFDTEEIDAAEKYGALLDQFVESAAHAALPDDVRPHAAFVVSQLLYFSWEYLGVPLEKLSPPDLDEILTDLFPRKVSADADFYRAVPAALCAFLRWLGESNPRLAVTRICDAIEECAPAMIENAAEPSSWGPAKLVMMTALKEGVDVTNPDEYADFVMRYNERLMRNTARRPSPLGLDDDFSPAQGEPHDSWVKPIRRDQPRIGRNDPCPCGSGRKFKKCCARDQRD